MVLPMYISYAAMDGKVSEIADWIERPGVTRDLNDPDEDGWTALSRATRRNQCAVIELLLSRGADVRVGEAHGWTPLHHAALKGRARREKRIRGTGRPGRTSSFRPRNRAAGRLT